jgi:hypothetical protein
MATFTFPVLPSADREKLQALIEAQLLYERMNETRLFLVHVLALMGALLWLCLYWPPLFSQSTQAFILALWGTCGLATLAVSLWQRSWHHRRADCLAEYEAKQREEAG